MKTETDTEARIRTSIPDRNRVLQREYIVPFVLVTSLFLLWGLANNMTDTLLAAFKRIMDMSDTQTTLIQFAFYGSYFCFALPAALYIRKKSYKSGITAGLLLYAAGAMLFYPAAKVGSYTFYLIAIYIMAGGCSVLETTANPYILSMGSPETATRRLNIAQSFNPIGSILGILLSKYFILGNISLYSVSGTYASLGCVLLAILAVMVFSKMPIGKDTDRQDGLVCTLKRLAKNGLYKGGVIAQFFYVGAQIGVWSFTIRIVMQELGVTESQASTVYLITIICFCLSRFVYTWLMKWISPSKLLIAGAALSALMSIVVALTSGSGMILVIALVLVSVFMSLMFPTIYGMALSGIAKGDHPQDSKIGASGLIMAILGGAILTPLQGIISDHFTIYASYFIPAVCFLIVGVYGVYAVKHSR
ncbi:MAG: L-fucose:H+ symporter permease [Bacteroidales bacterium]|nr:L-fucose:H+ symporter permease [Bacteroidales bacterium]